MTKVIDFGPRLIAAREGVGWSQRELARRAGISRQAVALFEHGKGGTIRSLRALLSCLQLELDPEPNVVELRRASGLSLRELAARAKVSVSAIQRLESGLGTWTSMVTVGMSLGWEPRLSTIRPWYQRVGRTSAWDTPSALAATILQVVGVVDLDPCASLTTEVQARQRYLEHGLELPWFGLVWLNPPYANAATWVARALASLASGEADTVLALLPSRTGARYFQRSVLGVAEVLFLPGRLVFGDAKAAARFSSVLAVWGGNAAEIASRLHEQLGGVLVSAKGAFGEAST